MSIKINVDMLLTFFDEKPPDSIGDATSIVSLAGEELATVLFIHYATCHNNSIVKVKCHDGTPTTGKRKGPRLDQWIETKFKNGRKILFQTEIKNWSAHSLHGKRLSKDATKEELFEHQRNMWRDMWNNEKNKPAWGGVAKVLSRMKIPGNIDPELKLQPLLIYWIPIHPEGSEDCFFSVKVSSEDFNELYVFCISTYLRSILPLTKLIECEMPIVEKRFKWINKLFQ